MDNNNFYCKKNYDAKESKTGELNKNTYYERRVVFLSIFLTL